jgi:hypothetical protein
MKKATACPSCGHPFAARADYPRGLCRTSAAQQINGIRPAKELDWTETQIFSTRLGRGVLEIA